MMMVVKRVRARYHIILACHVGSTSSSGWQVVYCRRLSDVQCTAGFNVFAAVGACW